MPARTLLWVATSSYDGLEVQAAPARSNARPSQAAAADQATTYYTRDNIAPPFYRMFAAIFMGSAQTTDLRVGINMGAWETVITRKPDSAGRSSFNWEGREWDVMFYKPKTIRKAAAGKSANATQITLRSPSYTSGQWNKRLVALANDGSEHVSLISKTACRGLRRGGF